MAIEKFRHGQRMAKLGVARANRGSKWAFAHGRGSRTHLPASARCEL